MALVLLSFGAGPAWAQGPDLAARNAAMGQLKPPDGVGGCIYRALPADVRREALFDALAGNPSSSALQVAVSKVAARCTGRPFAKDDLPVVGAVTGAVRRSAAALALAQQFGVGQAALDQAWSTASPDEKSAFYVAAGDYLTPGASLSPRTLGVAPFAAQSGLSGETQGAAERFLRSYFLYTALSERSEARLAEVSSAPTN